MSDWREIKRTSSIEEMLIIWSPDIVGNAVFLNPLLYPNLGRFLLCWKKEQGVIIPVLKNIKDAYSYESVTLKNAPFDVTFPEKHLIPLTGKINKTLKVSFAANEKVKLYGQTVDAKRVQTPKCTYYPGSHVKVTNAYEKKDQPILEITEEEKALLLSVITSYANNTEADSGKNLVIAEKIDKEVILKEIQSLYGKGLHFHFETMPGYCEEGEDGRCDACVNVLVSTPTTTTSTTTTFDPLATTTSSTTTTTRDPNLPPLPATTTAAPESIVLFKLPLSERKCWKPDDQITLFFNHALSCSVGSVAGPCEENPVVSKISGGGFHAIALKANGIPVAWGYNASGQVTIPSGLSNIKAVAGGKYWSAVLKNNCTVQIWGAQGDGEYPIVAIPANKNKNLIQITIGDNHAGVLSTDGKVFAWGNDEGGDENIKNIPDFLSGITKIASGRYHMLALDVNRQVYAWGKNTHNQCTIPGIVRGSSKNIKGIAAGAHHSLVVYGSGRVFAWGARDRMSDGSTSNQTHWGAGTINHLKAEIRDAIAVACGAHHSLVLKQDKTVVAWGRNDEGQVTGTATFSPYCAVAEPVPNLTNVVAISAGEQYSMALREDGSVYVWGAWGSQVEVRTLLPVGLNLN